MSKRICENCYYCYQHGKCRRHSPSIDKENKYKCCWPLVEAYDWCGDWKSVSEEEIIS